MGRKKYTGGAADRKRRGLKAVVVPVTPEVLDLLHRAAGTFEGSERAISRWAAGVLEEAARARIEQVEIEIAERRTQEKERGP